MLEISFNSVIKTVGELYSRSTGLTFYGGKQDLLMWKSNMNPRTGMCWFCSRIKLDMDAVERYMESRRTIQEPTALYRHVLPK